MPTMRLRVSSLLWSMLRIVSFTAILCIGRAVALQTQAPQTPQQTQARDLLNQGVQAYKNGQHDEAARLFEQAKNLDPSLLNARLYLATTYASQCIPGAPSEENRRIGERAIEEYKGVLVIDPQNLSAIDGIGSLLFQMSGAPFNPDGFLESKSYHQKHLEIKPGDPEPYYWIGVIDWTLAFRANGELRQDQNKARSRGLRDTDPLPADLREQYTREFGPTIDEGIASLQKAIARRTEYDDAMAYLNLLYRRKADVAETQAQRDELTKMADELIDKVKDIKQKRAASQPQQP